MWLLTYVLDWILFIALSKSLSIFKFVSLMFPGSASMGVTGGVCSSLGATPFDVVVVAVGRQRGVEWSGPASVISTILISAYVERQAHVAAFHDKNVTFQREIWNWRRKWSLRSGCSSRTTARPCQWTCKWHIKMNVTTWLSLDIEKQAYMNTSCQQRHPSKKMPVLLVLMSPLLLQTAVASCGVS